MGAKPAIALYISSHGFGHATRCLEVLRHIPEDIDLEIIGTVPEWLASSCLQRPYRFHKLLHDPGLAQMSSLEQDMHATEKRWREILDNYPDMADAEAARLADSGVRLTFGDISPFSRLVADRLQVPNVIIANFSWDWILAPHVADVPGLADVIDAVSGLFRRCDLMLRTPLDGDLSIFPRQERVPLVARSARRSRQEVRQELNIPDDKPLVLLSFGGHDQGAIPDEVWQQHSDLTFVLLRTEPSPAPNVLTLEPAQSHHPDIMGAVDAVVGKLGYGLVGEALCHQVPFLYVERHGFPETEIMERDLPRYLPVAKISQQEFEAGDWSPLRSLLESDRNAYETMRTDGGPVCASRLITIVHNGGL